MGTSTDQLQDRRTIATTRRRLTPLARARRRARRGVRLLRQLVGLVPDNTHIASSVGGNGRNGAVGSADGHTASGMKSLSATTERVIASTARSKSSSTTHHQAMRLVDSIDGTTPLSDVASLLSSTLSAELTAYVSGVEDHDTIHQLVEGEVTELSPGTEDRLRTAYTIIRLLNTFEAPEVTRSWFVGSSPYLNRVSPARSILNGNLEGALAAAHAFVASGYH